MGAFIAIPYDITVVEFNGTLHWELVLYDFPLVVIAYIYIKFFPTLVGACLEVVFEFDRRATYFGS